MTASTYHNRDYGKFNQRDERHHKGDKGPASLTLVLAALHDDGKGDEGGEAHDDDEGGHEADRLPHGAEVALALMTELLVGEAAAGRVVEAGAALVQADVLLEGLAFGGGDRVVDPVGDGY